MQSNERFVLESIAQLPKGEAESFLKLPWVPQAIFRLLPEAARNYMARLSLCPAPESGITEQDVKFWAVNPSTSDSALAQLKALKLISIDKHQTPPTISTNPYFVSSLRPLILQDTEPEWTKSEEPNITDDPDEEEIEKFSQGQWNRLLSMIVSGGNRSEQQETQRRAALHSAETLLECSGILQDGKLTNSGFQFLLKDLRAQIWTILSACITTESPSISSDDSALSLILHLSLLQPWLPYSSNDFSDGNKSILTDLSELGVLLFQPARDKFFISKSLHSALLPRSFISSGQSMLGNSTTSLSSAGGIVVESNFRLYAFVNNTNLILISLIKLFANPIQRLPGLFVASITRNSIRKALVNGITASQIIAFLQKNAHPSAASLPQPVPATVCDQVNLWEHERSRISFEPAVMLEGFATQQQLIKTRQKAVNQRSLLWTSDRLQRIIVKQPYYDSVLSQPQQQQPTSQTNK